MDRGKKLPTWGVRVVKNSGSFMDGSLGQNHKLNWGCQNLRTSIIEESMVYIQVMI